MSSFTRKMIISVFSLLFSISILGTVTYAWFSLATTNILDNLSLRISVDDLEISLDGINYYNEVPTEVVDSFISNDVRLQAVTTVDGINFFTGGPYATDIPATRNVDYISLTFYFRTTRFRESNVYLIDNVSNEVTYDQGKSGTYVVSNGISWTANYEFIYSETEIIRVGDQRKYHASDAIRFGFVEERITENSNDTRVDEELTNKIFDMSKRDRGYGVTYGGLDYYNKSQDLNITPPKEFPNTFYELTDFKKENPYVPENLNSKILELVKTDLLDEKGLNYYMGKTTLNIWLEGWDADCFDSIFADMIRMQLKFKNGRSIEN